MTKITCKAARAVGLKRYFTGKPCKCGHVDQRYIANSKCVTCARDAANKLFRGLDCDKREERREYERRRWQTPEFRARAKQYARQDKERIRKSVRNRAWKKANRISCTDRQNKRNAILYTVFVEDVSLDFLFDRDHGQCQLCGYVLSMTTKWPHPRTPTRDHIVPLSKCGTHERSNLQLACGVCNIAKGNRAVA